jgi:hypothetical protein
MGWVRIDDSFADHPKIAKAGIEGLALQIAGLCYANRQRTDGEIPAKIARTLLDLPQPQRVIRRLVSLKIWEEIPGGFLIHNYDQYQPSRAEIDDRRRAKAMAGRKGAHSKWHGKSHGTSQADAMAGAMADGMAGASAADMPPTQPNPNIDKSSSSLTSVGTPSVEDDDDEILRSVWQLLHDRRLEANRTQVANQRAWSVKVTREVARLHAVKAYELVRGGVRNPQAIADRLEPPATAPPEPERPYDRPDVECRDCDGTGWVESADGAIPCDGCGQVNIQRA